MTATPGGMEQIERMRNWLEVVDRYIRLARSPVDSGVAAVITANDLLRPRGTEAAIDYFSKMLPEVKNEAVQRAIRLQLIELYKASGQQEKALEQIRVLMTELANRPEASPPVPGAPAMPHER
jgi:thioredoxin-like negative regulator of GroEL